MEAPRETQASPIRVLIAAFHLARWDNLIKAMSRHGSIKIEQCIKPDSNQLHRAINVYKPDILLMEDYSEVVEVARKIRFCRSVFPAMRVMVIGTGRDKEKMLTALSAGAKGYMAFGSRPETLVKAVRTVYRGNLCVLPSVISEFHDRVTRVQALSQRERQVLDLAKRGYINKEIANKLGISERTVKFHITNIKHKLHVKRKREI